MLRGKLVNYEDTVFTMPNAMVAVISVTAVLVLVLRSAALMELI